MLWTFWIPLSYSPRCFYLNTYPWWRMCHDRTRLSATSINETISVRQRNIRFKIGVSLSLSLSLWTFPSIKFDIIIDPVNEFLLLNKLMSGTLHCGNSLWSFFHYCVKDESNLNKIYNIRHDRFLFCWRDPREKRSEMMIFIRCQWSESYFSIFWKSGNA